LLDSVKRKAEELLESIEKAEKAAQFSLAKRSSWASEKLRASDWLVPSPNDTTYQYAVENLPKGKRRSSLTSEGKPPKLENLEDIDEVQGTWSGKYETLRTRSRRFNTRSN